MSPVPNSPCGRNATLEEEEDQISQQRHDKAGC